MAFSEFITQFVYNEKFLNSLGGLIIILSVVLLIIIFVEMRVKKTVQVKLNEKGIAYLKKIDKIKKTRKKPSQEIKELNSIIKNFLKEYLKISAVPTYGEALGLMESKKNGEDVITLCNEMSEIIYAGEKPTEENVNRIIELFEKIIKYHVIKIDEEKAKEIEKILDTKEDTVDERKIRVIMSTVKGGLNELKKGNIQEAYKAYNVINALFKNLNSREKLICKKKIMEFYGEIAKKSQGGKPEKEKS